MTRVHVSSCVSNEVGLDSLPGACVTFLLWPMDELVMKKRLVPWEPGQAPSGPPVADPLLAAIRRLRAGEGGDEPSRAVDECAATAAALLPVTFFFPRRRRGPGTKGPGARLSGYEPTPQRGEHLGLGLHHRPQPASDSLGAGPPRVPKHRRGHRACRIGAGSTARGRRIESLGRAFGVAASSHRKSFRLSNGSASFYRCGRSCATKRSPGRCG